MAEGSGGGSMVKFSWDSEDEISFDSKEEWMRVGGMWGLRDTNKTCCGFETKKSPYIQGLITHRCCRYVRSYGTEVEERGGVRN